MKRRVSGERRRSGEVCRRWRWPSAAVFVRRRSRRHPPLCARRRHQSAARTTWKRRVRAAAAVVGAAVHSQAAAVANNVDVRSLALFSAHSPATDCASSRAHICRHRLENARARDWRQRPPQQRASRRGYANRRSASSALVEAAMPPPRPLIADTKHRARTFKATRERQMRSLNYKFASRERSHVNTRAF